MAEVLQLGCFGCDNLGDEIVASEIRRQLRQRFGEHELRFTMVTRDLEMSRQTHRDVADFIHEEAIPRGLGRRYPLVVFGGGTVLGERIMRSGRRFMRAQQGEDANLFVWGAGVNPMAPGTASAELRRFASLARLITVRNERCARYLADVGITGVEVTADAAFGVPTRPHEPRNRVGVNLSESVRKLGWRGRRALVVSLAEALNRHQERRGSELRFLPMRVRADGAWRSDRDWAEAIGGQLGARLTTVQDNSAETVLRELAEVELFIGSRLHGCLLAATTGCRVVGIGWSDKMIQLFADIGLADQLLDPRDLRTSEPLLELMESARAPHAARIAELKRRAKRTAELVTLSREVTAASRQAV